MTPSTGGNPISLCLSDDDNDDDGDDDDNVTDLAFQFCQRLFPLAAAPFQCSELRSCPLERLAWQDNDYEDDSKIVTR